jgi:hypothetical protein
MQVFVGWEFVLLVRNCLSALGALAVQMCKKYELDLIRIAESYRELREMMPPVIRNQLDN